MNLEEAKEATTCYEEFGFQKGVKVIKDWVYGIQGTRSSADL